MYKPSNDKSKAQAALTQELRDAVDTAEADFGAEHPDTIAAIEKLARHLLDVFEDAEAEPYFKRVCDQFEKTLGPTHPETLARLARMAELLTDLDDRDDDASALYLRVLEGRMKSLGEEHPDTLQSLADYADFLEYQDDYPQAEALYVRAVESARKVFGPEHPKTEEYESQLGYCRKHMGKADPEDKAPANKKGCATSAALLILVTVLVICLS